MSVRPWALFVTALSLALSTAALAPATTEAATATRAAGVGTWGPAHRFERDPRGQSMAVGPHGVVTVAWGSQQAWPGRVKVARRTSAGRWQAPVTLGAGYDPVVATDALGNLTVAWVRDQTGSTTGVWVARRPVGKRWTTPVHVSSDASAPGYPDGGSTYGATGLDVATKPNGAAIVTWVWGNWERDVAFRVQAVHRSASGGWGPVRTLTPATGAASDAQVVIATDGTAWVAYDRSTRTGPSRVVVRSRSATGTWHRAERIAVGSLGSISLDARGHPSVVLLGHGRVQAVRRHAGGEWGTPQVVTPPDVRVHDWSVAVDRHGAALVTYLRGHDRVDAVRRGPGGRWTAPVTLADPADRVSGVLAAVGAGGDMFAGWDNSYGIWGRYRAAGHGWRTTTTAHPDSGGVDVLEDVSARVTAGGDVALLWAQEARPLRVRVLEVR